MRSRALLIGVTSAVIAGCGGTEAGGDLTQDAFAAEANTICEQRETKIPASGPPQSREELIAMFERLATVEGEEIEQLRALEPPAEVSPQFTHLLTLHARSHATALRGHEAFLSGDTQTMTEALAALEELRPTMAQISDRLGLASCAKYFRF